uniref:Uncharacterized protein n=1 Tax=Timema shepardi TaxID=629360 RepID=A0A7R9FWA2_TIMSH|nr:unnamed protein product [Timema shepardi]
MASLVLTDSSQLTSDSQHLDILDAWLLALQRMRTDLRWSVLGFDWLFRAEDLGQSRLNRDELNLNKMARADESEFLRLILEARGLRVPIVVVGNKEDLSEEGAGRAVPKEVAETTALFDWECGYVECSAKNNRRIVDVFKELLVQAKVRYNLSPAVRRRRQSLPNYVTGSGSAKSKHMLKRNSCTVA